MLLSSTARSFRRACYPALFQRFLSGDSTSAKIWNVYLSGEIHSDWRDVIAKGVASLPIRLTSPNTSHEDSDDCGTNVALSLAVV